MLPDGMHTTRIQIRRYDSPDYFYWSRLDTQHRNVWKCTTSFRRKPVLHEQERSVVIVSFFVMIRSFTALATVAVSTTKAVTTRSSVLKLPASDVFKSTMLVRGGSERPMSTKDAPDYTVLDQPAPGSRTYVYMGMENGWM